MISDCRMAAVEVRLFLGVVGAHGAVELGQPIDAGRFDLGFVRRPSCADLRGVEQRVVDLFGLHLPRVVAAEEGDLARFGHVLRLFGVMLAGAAEGVAQDEPAITLLRS